jgi:hypothetical protein
VLFPLKMLESTDRGARTHILLVRSEALIQFELHRQVAPRSARGLGSFVSVQECDGVGNRLGVHRHAVPTLEHDRLVVGMAHLASHKNLSGHALVVPLGWVLDLAKPHTGLELGRRDHDAGTAVHVDLLTAVAQQLRHDMWLGAHAA